MDDCLRSEALMSHVRALADIIGPRPAGHAQEAQARDYVRRALAELKLGEVEELPFSAPDTWGYALAVPLLLTLGANLFGRSRSGKLAGALVAGVSAYGFWKSMGCARQIFLPLFPRRASATLIARIPPAGEKKRTLVLLGHTDSNKHRLTFAPDKKRSLLLSTSAGLAGIVINGLAQLAGALGIAKKTAALTQWASAVGLLGGLATTLQDESEGYIDGANDNASAVACLLGLGGQLAQQPLQHTEVWLAFTGAEEVGGLGTHALLDAHGAELGDAWFLDLEMVGAGQVAYVTRHSGLSYFNAYEPDPDSLEWAAATAWQNPELGAHGAQPVICEEVGALRSRGYRGICLIGLGEDGWLVNWHQYSDNSANIQPQALERAARLAWVMLHTLDAR